MTTVDVSKHRRIGPKILVAVVAVACAATIIWYLPPNEENRLRHLSLVSLRHIALDNQSDFKVWKEMGIRLAKLGDQTQAEVALETAHKLRTEDVPVSIALGKLYVETGKFGEANTILRTVLGSDVSNVDAHEALGHLYFKLKDFTNARAEFASIVRSRPNSSEAWFRQAQCDLELHAIPRALDAINRATTINNADPRYLALKGLIDFKTSAVDNGIQEARKAAELSPDDIAIQFNLTDLLLSANRNENDLTAAEQSIGKMEQIQLEYPNIPFERARLEVLHRNWLPAIRYLQASLRADPQNEDAMLMLIQAYAKTNRLSELKHAKTVYDKIHILKKNIPLIRQKMETGPSDISLYPQLAQIYMKLGDKQQAINTINDGLMIDPGNPVLEEIKRSASSTLNSSQPYNRDEN